MTTKLIEYIGRQTNRVDDVLHTRRIWPSRGSVLEIPDKEAPHYLMFAKEWREITPEQYAARESARSQANDNLLSMKDIWADLSVEDLESMRDEINDEITERRNAPVIEAEAVSAEAAPDTEAEDGASQTAAAERIQKIIAVIKDMDPNDDEQFTQNGAPRVPVVTDRVGFKVSFDEIGEAMDLING